MTRTAILALLATLLAACGGGGPEDSSPASPPAVAGVRYSCGEIPFDPAVLAQAGGAETGSDPVSVALRQHLEANGPESGSLPRTGWIPVGSTPVRVEFVARDPAGGYAFVSVENAGGGWSVGGWGGCTPRAVLPGRSLAAWVLDPGEPPPGPDTTTFTAHVTEQSCASGKGMGARLGPPEITYGETEVLVRFSAVPLVGGQDCPGNPSSRVVVELREPLGERRLLDASVYPPADPVTQ